ncbi:leucine-rich repeat domain-containing protein [Spirosoma koreense]
MFKLFSSNWLSRVIFLGKQSVAPALYTLWLGLSISLVQAQSYNSNGVTVAGVGGQGNAANQLFNPLGIWVDATGNLYVADTYNDRVQKWASGATSGTTVAGGNGPGSAANQLGFPSGMWVDAVGNVYIADNDNLRIQKWAPGASSGTTVAGGNGRGSAANQFDYGINVAVDAAGNVYVADPENYRVQKWAPGASSGTTVASPSTSVDQYFEPLGLFIDAAGNLYVADGSSSRIQKFSPGASRGTIVAGGNGRGSAANQLSNPQSVWVDAAGNIYVADQLNNRIQKWAPGATSGTTVAGGNGHGDAANQFMYPGSVAVDGAGNLYVADPLNNRVQRFSPLGVPTLSGLSVSPSAVCAGSSVRFTATVGNVTGSYTYTLTNGAGSVNQGTASTGSFSQTLTAAGSGLQTFTLTVANGGPTAKATTNLTVTSQSADYQALADLFNATNGPGWTNKTGWLSSCTPCGWAGVTCDGNGRVTQLRLYNNNLNGTLPTSLSALTSLQTLDLQSNNLSGTIPASLSTLTSLQTLNLSVNSLSGSIPASLSALTALRELLLFNTGLSGSIPEGLSALTALQTLDLHNGALSGSIPGSLAALTGLQTLDLSGNQLSGCLPASLSAFCGTTSVNISNNPALPGGGDFAAFCQNGTGSQLVVNQYPSSTSACVGSPFSFSVVARGATSYEWYKEGQRLAETGPILSFSPVTATDGGTYRVIVNGACGDFRPGSFTLTARSDGPCTPRPDLTPVLYARNSTISGSQPISIVVDIFELNNVPTSGPITVKVSKDARIALSFNPTLTSVGGRPVKNSAWSFSGPSGGFYTLTTAQIMGGGESLSFGLTGTLTPGATSGALTASAVIVAGSGGEVVIDNNNDADKIDYFQQ